MVFDHLDLIIENGLFGHGGMNGSLDSIYNFRIYRVGKLIFTRIPNFCDKK